MNVWTQNALPGTVFDLNSYYTTINMSKFSSNQYEYVASNGTFYSDIGGEYALTFNASDNQTILDCDDLLPGYGQTGAVKGEYSYDQSITSGVLAAASYCELYTDTDMEYTESKLYQFQQDDTMYLDPYKFVIAPLGFYGIFNTYDDFIRTVFVDVNGGYVEYYDSCEAFEDSYTSVTLYYSATSELHSCALAYKEDVAVEVEVFYDYDGIGAAGLLTALGDANFNFDAYIDIYDQTIMQDGWYSDGTSSTEVTTDVDGITTYVTTPCPLVISTTSVDEIDDESTEPCDEDTLITAVYLHTIKEYPFLNTDGGDIYVDDVLTELISIDSIYKTKFCVINGRVPAVCNSATAIQSASDIATHGFNKVDPDIEFALNAESLIESTSIVKRNGNGDWEQPTPSHYSDGYAFKLFDATNDELGSDYIQVGLHELRYSVSFKTDIFTSTDTSITYNSFAYDGNKELTEVLLANATTIYKEGTTTWEHADVGFYSDSIIVRHLNSSGVLSLSMNVSQINLVYQYSAVSICALADNTSSKYFISINSSSTFASIDKIYELSAGGEVVPAIAGSYLHNDGGGVFSYRTVYGSSGSFSASIDECAPPSTISSIYLTHNLSSSTLYPSTSFRPSEYFINKDKTEFDHVDLEIFSNDDGTFADSGFYVYGSVYRYWNEISKKCEEMHSLGRTILLLERPGYRRDPSSAQSFVFLKDC
jgi:hypothetical protein